jgi:hypothetical protein
VRRHTCSILSSPEEEEAEGEEEQEEEGEEEEEFLGCCSQSTPRFCSFIKRDGFAFKIIILLPFKECFFCGAKINRNALRNPYLTFNDVIKVCEVDKIAFPCSSNQISFGRFFAAASAAARGGRAGGSGIVFHELIPLVTAAKDFPKFGGGAWAKNI